MTRQSKARIGIIGAGFMGTVHAGCYARAANATIAMIASRSEDKARGAAERFGADAWTSDWRQLVWNDAVDAVDITAPNHLHHEIAMAAIAARKPFLVEKPLAMTTVEADEIVGQAHAQGISAVYGENMRFSPAAIQARSIIDQGGIGSIILMRSTEIHNGPFHSDWFWDAKSSGGGAVIDMGIHGLFLLEWLAGCRAKRVYAETGTLKWTEQCQNGAEDSAFVTLRFENGAIAELLNSWAIAGGRDVRAEIYGTRGTIHLDKARGEGGMLVYSEDGYGPPVETQMRQRPHVSSNQGWHFPSPDPWRMHGHAYVVEHFIDVVLHGATPLCTLEDGRRALQLVEAIYESARTSKPVTTNV